MGHKITIGLMLLLLLSSAAQAWQPVIYPIRSQSPYQRSIDTAMCYATANKQTKINIAHESQIPPRKPPPTKTSSTGIPSRPPLPPSSFSATPMGASMPAAATAPAASAPASTTETNKAASATIAATAASSTSAGTGASETAAASAPQTAQGPEVKLPPLPAPEPPMTRYWAAYGACMQARGYVVMQ